MANASPIASAAVVLLVGARFSGHASFFTLTVMWWLEYFAKSESGLPVMEMRGTFMCSTMGMKRSNSSV